MLEAGAQVGAVLFSAIVNNNVDEAFRLLQRPVAGEVLNRQYSVNGMECNLLHFAISGGPGVSPSALISLRALAPKGTS